MQRRHLLKNQYDSHCKNYQMFLYAEPTNLILSVITFMIISSNEKDIDCLSNILLTTDLKCKQVNNGTFITIKIVIDFIGLISRSSGKRFRFHYI